MGDTDEYSDVSPAEEYIGGESGAESERERRRKYRSKITEKEKLSLFHIISIKIAEKLLDGLLSTYKLRGHFGNLIRYLRVIFEHTSQPILSAEYDKAMEEGYGIPRRTRRRYDEGIRKGEVPSFDLNGSDTRTPRTKDLTVGAVDEIRRLRGLRKRHHRKGYLTRNQLIETLSSQRLVSELNEREGLQFQRLSKTTLKKRIKVLLGLKKITCEEEGSAQYFNINDFPQIAREIMTLAKK